MSTTVNQAPSATPQNQYGSVPMARQVKIELRKMFDTRSGFWLMASVAIVALIATVCVIAFVDADDLSYGLFGSAIGFPLAVILPIIAVMSVTSEWSQRTGLTTFTLVPNRNQPMIAKAIACLIIAVVSMLFALGVGALGNIVGSAIAGADTTWDFTVGEFFGLIAGNVVGIFMGYVFGLLFRSTAVAVVLYLVYGFVMPTLFGALASFQEWFDKIWPWIDLNIASSYLFNADLGGNHLAQLGTSLLIWMIIPLAIGIYLLRRSEVK